MNEEEEDFCKKMFIQMKTNIYGQGKIFYLFMTVNLDFSNKKNLFWIEIR